MIYVDDMRARLGRLVMCHMVADTAAELHAMAAAIGVRRRWYQGDHYDICLAKRRMAIASGARAVTLRQLAAMAGLRRLTGVLGEPARAIDRLRAEKRALRGSTAPAKSSRAKPESGPAPYPPVRWSPSSRMMGR